MVAIRQHNKNYNNSIKAEVNYFRLFHFIDICKKFMSYRIGFGIDYHQLGEGRKLMLGGVHIPHSKGAIGHSDADVLLHAICDALLGAACLGDIGVHFPDTDDSYKNIDSKILLQKTMELISKEGYSLINIDSTLCLEEPKIKPFVPQMQQTIASLAGLTIKDVSIKATTTETMGFVGRKEGLKAYATILLQQKG
jgi:2-C-methyl-D-erythritol 2,4-cyclodiphosphate synthase